jgi:hypothetical protein
MNRRVVGLRWALLMVRGSVQVLRAEISGGLTRRVATLHAVGALSLAAAPGGLDEDDGPVFNSLCSFEGCCLVGVRGWG